MGLFGPRDKAGAGKPATERKAQEAAPVLTLGADGFARLRDSCVVYSNFRAGSHLLQSSLAALTRLQSVDEVFARTAENPLGLSRYLATAEADAQGLLLDPERHLSGYFRYMLNGLDHDSPLVLSVKYSQAHRLGVDDLTGAPIILKVLADYRVPVLHLIRRDVVQQAISHLVATETGGFDAFSGSGTQGDRSLWLDPTEVVALARSRAEEQRRARAHLETLSIRHLTVYYEELATGRIAEELRRSLRFLDRYAPVPEGFTPPTTALESDRRVANRAEILDHLLARAPDLLHGLSF